MLRITNRIEGDLNFFSEMQKRLKWFYNVQGIKLFSSDCCSLQLHWKIMSLNALSSRLSAHTNY